MISCLLFIVTNSSYWLLDFLIHLCIGSRMKYKDGTLTGAVTGAKEVFGSIYIGTSLA